MGDVYMAPLGTCLDEPRAWIHIGTTDGPLEYSFRRDPDLDANARRIMALPGTWAEFTWTTRMGTRRMRALLSILGARRTDPGPLCINGAEYHRRIRARRRRHA